MLNPRKSTLERFRSSLSEPDAFLVGAAVGAGVTARAAERGGADMLVALNAGRFRMMGVSSMASMLPLRDSNRMVLDFGLTEVLNQSELPTIFGAASHGSTGDLDRLIVKVKTQGYAGICNFPTCIHYSEAFQQVLERAGLGFAREIELVKRGQAAGLTGIVYVSSVNQARQAAQAGADIVCMNFGWNTGGTTGVVASLSLDEVASRTHEFVRTARSWKPDILCLLEGGPIEKAADLFEICRNANVDGYIGGSTLDLIPLGHSVAETTTEFKMTRVLHGRIETLEKRLATYQISHSVIGASPQILAVTEQMRALGPASPMVVVRGASGTGRSLVAETIARRLSGEQGTVGTYSFDTDSLEQRVNADLFGIASHRQHVRESRIGLVEQHKEGVLILENVERAPNRVQRRLVQLIESADFKRVYGRKLRSSGVRLVLTVRQEADKSSTRAKLREDLAKLLQQTEISLPLLNERIGDIPDLVRHFAEENTRAFGLAPLELGPSAIRELMSHDWPGNVAELARVVKNLQAVHAFGKVSAETVGHTLNQSPNGSSGGTADNSERAWILQALRKHGFRRARAAAELGISRKTLYNKIKRHQIMGSGGD